MNWIFTCFFLIVIFLHYSLLGEGILSFFSFESSLNKRIIAGFFFTFFLTFLIGFPCQVFHVSWNLYFVLQIFEFVLIDVVAFFYQRNRIKSFLHGLRIQNIFPLLLNAIKNNWIGLLFVFGFTIFSMANQLPIYQMNYDDFYYIGKITNQIGADRLLNENYFSGAVLNDNSFNIVRVINTFELGYGFFASIFHINVTFFCRGTMVIHNYILFVMVYKELASLIITRKYSQFALVPFFIFLIPQGYLHNMSFMGIIPPIRSYDLWQFQTAVFYGGSVVRMLSIPTLFIFAYPMLKGLEFKKIIWLAIISISCVSFSTIFIQNFIIFMIGIFFTYFIVQIYCGWKDKRKKKVLVNILLLLSLVFFLLSTKLWDHLSIINTEAFRSSYEIYADFDNVWVQSDLILKLFPWVFLLGVFLSKGILKKAVFFFVGLLYLLFKTSLFYEFLTISSFNQFFVIYRSISSVQYMCLLLFAVVIILIYFKISKNIWVPSAVSISAIVSIVIFFKVNSTNFINYSYNGSGISTAGWNFERVFQFDNKMTTNVFYEVGEYFNTLPYGNYRFFAPSIIKIDSIDSYELGFLMSSNRIQIHERGGFDGITKEESEIISNYCLTAEGNYAEVIDLLNKYETEYLLISNETHKDEMIFRGAQEIIKIDNISGPYYLLKL